MTPAQRQQLISLGINPDLNSSAFAPQAFGMQTQQAQPMQMQQQPQASQTQAQPPQSPGIPPWLSAMFAPQQQSTGIDWKAIGDIVHPPDIQGEANKAYVPGVDNAANPFSNGFFGGRAGHIAAEEKAWGPGNSITQNGVNPQAQAQTQSNMMAAFAPQAAQAVPQLPWTMAAMAPVGQNPGYSSPQFPDYLQRIQQQLHNPFAALR